MLRAFRDEVLRQLNLETLYWGCRFWGRGYFSTTNGAITEDIVRQYLENHIADPTGAGL